jgi:membrane protease YdiL (CAAX protease family)
MESQSLKKTTIVFFVCFLSLFITNRLLDVFVERTEVLFLIISFVKLILILFIFKSLRNEQKKVSSLIKNWQVFILIIVVVAYLSYSNTQNIIDSKDLDISRYFHISYIFESFATGFFEEILFRVFIFYSLVNSNFFRPETRVFKSYILTSLIFGFCHITNLFHYELYSVINQILLAFGLGLIFQMLFTKYKNILFIASLHALINYFGMRNSTLFKTGLESGSDQLTNVFLNIGVFFFLDLIITFYVYLFIKKRV